MADENTQVPLDSANLSDDEPFSMGSWGDSQPLVNEEPEEKRDSSTSPSKRWKRDCLSPQDTAAPESGRSQDEASPIKKKPATAAPDSKSAKRVKARDESRLANDLMNSFLARASAASSSTDTKKKPAAASAIDVD